MITYSHYPFFLEICGKIKKLPENNLSKNDNVEVIVPLYTYFDDLHEWQLICLML